MSHFSIDQGHAALVSIIDTYKGLALQDANEAETRLKVIDHVLRDVLGWQEDDFRVEERCSEDGSTTYADYIIRTATTGIIVEAKKAGATFTLPPRQTGGKLGGAISSGDLGEAIRQVRDYCRKKSIPFAVVTNGDTWVVFPAVRTDGMTFEETQARVFKSLDDIHKNRFIEFWELLSRQRVIEGNLENELLQTRRVSTTRRILSLLPEPGYRLGRNSLYEYIEPAVNAVLTDEALLDDVEALKACYVKNSERVKYDTRLQMHVIDTKPRLGHKTIRAMSRKGSKYLETKIEEGNTKLLRLILLLGSVGAGKTTFLTYTRKVSAAEHIDNKVVWIYVDFKKATATDDPRKFIYSELKSFIENDEEFSLGDWDHSIKPAYAEMIRNLERGPLKLLKNADPVEFEKEISRRIMEDYNEVQPYVEAVLRRATENRVGFLVIDNVDQIDSDERQNAIFAEAQVAARKMGLNIIMSMRDATYLRHRTSPVFDAFQHESIYIDPPAVNAVLSRRFGYAKLVLANRGARLRMESGMVLAVPDLSVIFDIVAHSMLEGDTGFMLEILSGGDIRRGLSLVREFLSSGHTSADKAIQVFLSHGSYRFPTHEVFKGAMLGPRKYYREEESHISNIFDSKLGIPSLQLLSLHILARFVQLASESNFEGLKVEEIEEQLHRVGIASEDVYRTLRPLVQSTVLKTVNGQELATASTLIPTRLAGYMINHLASWFNYVEMCVIDSNIFDDAAWDELSTITQRVEACSNKLDKIKLRLDRARKFMEYLARIEERWVVECRRRGLESNWAPQHINRITTALEDSFPKIISSATRVFSQE